MEGTYKTNESENAEMVCFAITWFMHEIGKRAKYLYIGPNSLFIFMLFFRPLCTTTVVL